ncbi:MAG: hypothetical protein WBC85_04890 [Planktotalea sp.]|uniref:hypothetical protein n=1 Tax=Planktotalea sp. TaxID=2029877 RepID=UPI003C78D0F7
MAFTRSLMLCSALALAGCGGGLSNSWVNPANWFGNSRAETLGASGTQNPLIPKPSLGKRPKPVYQGQPVDQIAALRIERRPGGAIIHVVGVTDVIGYYDARLEPESLDGAVNGVLAYTLTAVRPAHTVGVGGEAARQINVARFVSDQELADVRTVTVKGARNQRSTRRR